jgi:hypothetical protein
MARNSTILGRRSEMELVSFLAQRAQGTRRGRREDSLTRLQRILCETSAPSALKKCRLILRWSLWLLAVSILLSSTTAIASDKDLKFTATDEHVDISIGSQRVARYVLRDKEILRPYFSDVTTLSGRQVTRNHPPKKGEDPTDHSTMHPGIWVAFGDLGGEDFWRNKGRVVHRAFLDEPKSEGNRGSFVAENEYVTGKDEKTICRERCTWSFIAIDRGWWLLYDGEFTAAVDGIALGDQEEMGIGVRMATPLSVAKGGTIIDDRERKDEKGVWGQQPAWCDYAGTIDGCRVGIAIVPHAKNFRSSWFHVRDYGLMVANPFGQNAFTRGEKSRIDIPRDKPLRLRFAVLVHESEGETRVDFGEEYKKLAQLVPV